MKPARAPFSEDIKEPITYCIILFLADECRIQIGHKGLFAFNSGFYAYVGSAKRNASSRMSRHWLGTGKKKWHIDYLRAETVPQSIWGFSQRNLAECQLADFLLKSQFDYLPGFGSSDCHCPSHLFFCLELSKLESQLASLGSVFLKHSNEFERGFNHEPISREN